MASTPKMKVEVHNADAGSQDYAFIATVSVDKPKASTYLPDPDVEEIVRKALNASPAHRDLMEDGESFAVVNPGVEVRIVKARVPTGPILEVQN